MKKISIVLLLFLASCGKGPQQGKDGYVFGEKQYEQSPVTVSVVVYKRQKDIYLAAKAKGANYPDVTAFSVLSGDRATCTIHMIDPSVKYAPEFVGHEFLHCVYGQWHKDNNTF
jgi:hypothetical protein